MTESVDEMRERFFEEHVARLNEYINAREETIDKLRGEVMTWRTRYAMLCGASSRALKMTSAEVNDMILGWEKEDDEKEAKRKSA
jgi:hypothetical protein